MKSNAALLLIHKIYDNVHMALWAILIAFVLWFPIAVMPKLPAIHARAEVLHQQQIAAEQDFYCTKLGMGPTAAMYHQCLSYLQDYRAKIKQRDIDENSPFF